MRVTRGKVGVDGSIIPQQRLPIVVPVHRHGQRIADKESPQGAMGALVRFTRHTVTPLSRMASSSSAVCKASKLSHQQIALSRKAVHRLGDA